MIRAEKARFDTGQGTLDWEAKVSGEAQRTLAYLQRSRR